MVGCAALMASALALMMSAVPLPPGAFPCALDDCGRVVPCGDVPCALPGDTAVTTAAPRFRDAIHSVPMMTNGSKKTNAITVRPFDILASFLARDRVVRQTS